MKKTTTKSTKTVKKVAKTTPKTKKKLKEVHIFQGNNIIRTYSEEKHGKDFEKLADSFVTKTGYEKRA